MLKLTFGNANSRETYFTMHRVKAAHKYGKGKSIKVGIIDWCFGTEVHAGIYAGSIDFANAADKLKNEAEHGFHMAQVLHEIAPECDIYALNYLDGNNFGDRVKNLEKAIMWAADNGINVISYAGFPFSKAEKRIVDKAVSYAVSKGVIAIFNNYDFEKNFLPHPVYVDKSEALTPDIRILHYNYNYFYSDQHERYNSLGKLGVQNGDDIPFFSTDSMSSVLAGFVAIILSIEKKITLEQCKKIFQATSRTVTFEGNAAWEDGTVDMVADVGKAAQYISQLALKK